MKKLMSLLMALLITFSYIPVNAAEGDIVDIASKDATFSTLVAALQKAELVSALQGEGPFTVFAPTDEAFAKLLGELNITAEDLLNHPDLSKVLLYHVVSGKVMSTDLSDGLEADTLLGEKLVFDLSGGVKVNASNVIAADVEATNGVIHVIDTVLVPEAFTLNANVETTMAPEMSIVDIALGDPSFSMLVALLQKAELVEALQGEGPFTVFAPTNDAFEALISSLGITQEELMAQPDLAKVLLYHVVSGKVMSTDLSNGLMAPTLNGNSITFDLTNGAKANSSNIILADVEATNGVVHVIDSVLVPSDFVLTEVTLEADSVPKTGVTSAFQPGAIGILTLMGLGLYILRKKYKAINQNN